MKLVKKKMSANVKRGLSWKGHGLCWLISPGNNNLKFFTVMSPNDGYEVFLVLLRDSVRIDTYMYSMHTAVESTVTEARNLVIVLSVTHSPNSDKSDMSLVIS